jgi:choline dehydrogenase-like flavoprotein
MSGTIVDLSRVPDPRPRSVDVCVIGSGCGGATAAWVLAEAGLDVLVLEEGGDRTGLELTQRDGEMYDQLYMDRGGRATDDLAITVLQGRALGGGGVINACDVVPIPDGVLAHWRRRFGLSELTDEVMAPYQARALEDLSASRPTEDQVNEANRLLRAGATELGYRGEVMMHNRVGCGGLGTCLIGCPLNAKKNPRFVAIPNALRAGASFWLRCRAARIEGGTEEVKTIHARVLDERGHHEQRDVTVRARRVIVAANAIGSAQLLLRSGLGNEHVGQNLMLQPQLPVVAIFDSPVRAFRGIPQAYAVTHFERHDHPDHGLWGFRIEAVMGTPGIVSTLLPFVGPENVETMGAYDRIAASLLLVPDRPSGRVSLCEDERPRIEYTQRGDHKSRLRRAVREAARVYLAAGATEVIVPTVPVVRFRSVADLDRANAMTFAPVTAPLLSAHQQGTVRMAPSASQGGADPDGQVYGTRGVYVFDTSVFPSSASSHTMAPTLAMSRYLASKLAAHV